MNYGATVELNRELIVEENESEDENIFQKHDRLQCSSNLPKQLYFFCCYLLLQVSYGLTIVATVVDGDATKLPSYRTTVWCGV